MRKLRMLIAVLISFCMIMGLGIIAFADDQATTGTITITNPVEGQSYKAYRLFDLESFDTDTGAYSYVLNSDFKAFAEQDTIRGTYITLTNSGSSTYVKWIDGASASAFAEKAIKWAEDNNKTPAGTVTASATDKTIENLPLGYYVVDSSLGTLCSLTTTNPTATINEKNDVPSVEKTVKNQETLNYGETNTAKIGDTVDFKTVINIGTGAVNFVLHDDMDNCFTLDTGSFAVKVGDDSVDTDKYTINTNPTDKDTFDIEFDDDYVASLKADTDIIVTYQAILNDKAQTASSTDDNENTTWLEYGDNNSTTTKDITKTLTFAVDVVKTDANSQVITGAKFKLYDSATDGNEIKLVLVSSDTDKGIYNYRVANMSDDNDKNNVVDYITAGKVTIKGLNASRYYLEETEAPKGYNKLSSRELINLYQATTDNTAVINDGGTYGKYDNGGVQVINNSGTILPETGGTGTMIIYIVSGAIIVCAFVFLILRRRSNN